MTKYNSNTPIDSEQQPSSQFYTQHVSVIQDNNTQKFNSMTQTEYANLTTLQRELNVDLIAHNNGSNEFNSNANVHNYN